MTGYIIRRDYHWRLRSKKCKSDLLILEPQEKILETLLREWCLFLSRFTGRSLSPSNRSWNKEKHLNTETIHPELSHICIHWIVPIFIRFCYLLNGILTCLTVFSINSYTLKKEAIFFFFFILMLQFRFLDAILHSVKYIMLAVMGH